MGTGVGTGWPHTRSRSPAERRAGERGDCAQHGEGMVVETFQIQSKVADKRGGQRGQRARETQRKRREGGGRKERGKKVSAAGRERGKNSKTPH